MTQRTHIDPAALAFYEAAGWHAYYQRDWPRVLWLMLGLYRAQFAMGWPDALAAALDTVRAAAAFAPLDNDLPTTRHFLTRFFDRARRPLGIAADATTLAELELNYWIVHRELARRRKAARDDADLTPMIVALARLHAAIFDSTTERMYVSAALRAAAAATVDRITGNYSDDIAADWHQVYHLLVKAYRAVTLMQYRPLHHDGS
jgi:hypothetical protein